MITENLYLPASTPEDRATEQTPPPLFRSLFDVLLPVPNRPIFAQAIIASHPEHAYDHALTRIKIGIFVDGKA